MNSTRVLVVDDEPLIRDMLARALEKAGYHVSTAEDGRAAVRHLQEQAVDVVLTDIIMPNMNGLEVIGYLQKEHPGVRILAMSGYNEACLEITAKLGAANVFMKPIKLHELFAAIERSP